ncbi:MAG TPA: NlpC/P60 family protein [Actinomycetota bacterium]|nr:NlpC/P60 family protein [Actinomycetota bacterium]
MQPRRRLFSALLALVAITAILPTVGLRAAPDPGDLEAARDRLFELEREFQLVSEEYNLVREDLVAIQGEMAEIRLVVREIQGRMDTKKAAAIKVATELYKSGPGAVAIESVLSAESLAEIETRLEYLKSTQTAQAKVFERLAVDQNLLAHNLGLLEADRAKALAAETRLTDLRQDIQGKVDDQKGEVATLNAAIARARRQAAAAEAAAIDAQPGIPLPPVNIKPAPAPNERAQVAVEAALSQVGKPYQWGAAGPDSYDCSGLTMWAWAQAGVGLPHNSGAQYSATVRVDQSDLASGDLMFFGSPIHHVAMYIGNGQMVEAPYSGQTVRVVSASRSDYVGAGRPGV